MGLLGRVWVSILTLFAATFGVASSSSPSIVPQHVNASAPDPCSEPRLSWMIDCSKDATSTPDIAAAASSTAASGFTLIEHGAYQGCPNYYEKKGLVYIQKTYPESDNANNPIVLFEGVDTQSFRVLSQAQGFSGFDCTYSEDTHHVYYKGDIIPGADPVSFAGLGVTDMAHDNQSVYFRTTKIPGLIGSTTRMTTVNELQGRYLLTDGVHTLFVSAAAGLDNNSDYTFTRITATSSERGN